VVKAHLEVCPSCRQSFSDLGAIHSTCFVQAPRFEVERSANEEDRLRNSILRAATRDGALFSAHVKPQNQYERSQGKVIGSFREIRGWEVAASLAVMGVCVLFGFALRQSQRAPLPAPAAMTQAILPSTVQKSNEPTSDNSRRQEEILEQEVAALKAERSRLERDLQREWSEGKDLRAANAGMMQQMGTLTTELETARAMQAKTEATLQHLKSERETDQSAIQAQNREIRSLNERLQGQSSQKERDQDVLNAEKRLRELVGARNLHIVDVYDTDANGKTKKAVGRVFYTQGQSLVFYAYDLSTNHFETGKYGYYVWGHKEGDDESVRNLGTLDPDDVAQKRWMLKVNDAKALSNIDRVFVTLEQNGKLELRPHGKKILSAYLGSPANHP
jgi:hypothetical protein